MKSKYNSESEIYDLVRSFEEATVSRDDWRHAEHLVVGSTSIDHNPQYPGNSTDRVLLHGCRNVSVTGLLLQHTRGADLEVPASIEIRDCENVNVTGCQVVHARGHGVLVRGSMVVGIADCTLRGRAEDKGYHSAVKVDGASKAVMVVGVSAR